jgi:hypothetical protein
VIINIIKFSSTSRPAGRDVILVPAKSRYPPTSRPAGREVIGVSYNIS